MERIPIDFDGLQLFVGVDEVGSLSAASRRLGIAQPNASRSIRRLERSLGVRLLDRGPSGSALTAQGAVLVHWARTVLGSAVQMIDVAAELRSENSAELTVSASMTVAEHLMPRWLGNFRSVFPETTVHLLVNNSSVVFDKVLGNECDLGFVESPVIPDGLHSLTVAQDSLAVVVHPDHPWARRRRHLGKAELASTALLVREPGSGTRTTLDAALNGFPRVKPLLELGSASAIRTSVAAGIGPAVLSTLAVTQHVESGELKVIPVEGLNVDRLLRVVWRPPRRIEGPAADLVRLIRANSIPN